METPILYHRMTKKATGEDCRNTPEPMLREKVWQLNNTLCQKYALIEFLNI